MSINLTVALVQQLRLSLQPVFQIMARQTSARFVDCTSARCDLFVGWPGLGLLEDHGFGLMSVFLIFHVLAVGCAWARCICSVGLGVPPAPQPGGFTCFVSAAAQSDVASTGRARCPNISRTPASSSANKIFTFMIEPSSEWFQNLSGDHANDECDRPNLQLHNFSAPQERARGFDCKARCLAVGRSELDRKCGRICVSRGKRGILRHLAPEPGNGHGLCILRSPWIRRLVLVASHAHIR